MRSLLLLPPGTKRTSSLSLTQLQQLTTQLGSTPTKLPTATANECFLQQMLTLGWEPNFLVHLPMCTRPTPAKNCLIYPTFPRLAEILGHPARGLRKRWGPTTSVASSYLALAFTFYGLILSSWYRIQY